jgi:signal transduction histidine kinase
MSPAASAVLAAQVVIVVGAWTLWHQWRTDRRRRINEALQLLVGDVSAALAAPATSDLDPPIQAAIERLAVLTGAVHVSLHTGVPGGTVWIRKSFVHPKTADTAAQGFYTTSLPYLYATVAAGREIRLSRATLLPREGWSDYPALLRLGVRSGFVLPLYVRGVFRGALALGMGMESGWRDDWVAPARRIGELALGALLDRELADAAARGGDPAMPPLSFDALFVTLDRSRRIVFSNSHEAWPGIAVGETYPPPGALDEHYRLLIEAGVSRVLDGKAPYVGLIVRVPSGRWFFVQIEPLNTAGRGAVVTHQDVSERTNTQGAAARALTTLAHQQRVAALGELASSLAHEISQPLGAIAANARAGALLVARDGGDGQAGAIFADIASDAMRAGDVVRQVRGLLRQDHAAEDVDVNALVSETIALVDSDAEMRQVRITTDLAPGALIAHIDGLQLQQVVMNLLTNAVDAAAARQDGRRLVRVRSRQTDRGIRLDVDDSGPGISPAQADRIFEPFFTTKPSGLGVGLSISRSIVSVAGGRIWTEPGDLEGARLSVELPAVRT